MRASSNVDTIEAARHAAKLLSTASAEVAAMAELHLRVAERAMAAGNAEEADQHAAAVVRLLEEEIRGVRRARRDP